MNEQISSSYKKSLVGAIKKLYLLLLDQPVRLDYLLPKRSENTLPKFFSKEEVRCILDGMNSLKHRAILMTIYNCGLRLSELLNLKIKDVRGLQIRL